MLVKYYRMIPTGVKIPAVGALGWRQWWKEKKAGWLKRERKKHLYNIMNNLPYRQNSMVVFYHTM